MKPEIIDKANKLQNDINCYEIIIRYTNTNCLIFKGMIGEVNISEDKQLAKIIYDYCKKKKEELIKEYEEL